MEFSLLTQKSRATGKLLLGKVFRSLLTFPGWIIGGVVELPLAIRTPQSVEELAGSLAHAFGFGVEVCEGGTDRWFHGRVACLAPLDRRL